MVISSAANPRLKRVRGLLGRRRERQATGLFVAEGEDLIIAAAVAGWPAEELLVADSAADTLTIGGLVDPDGGVVSRVEDALLADVSSLGSGTRVIGVYRQRWQTDAVGPRCLHLHGVRDPGNVGTAIRAAHALGASSVSLGPGSADPYGPKAVRASMGSLFGLPLARTPRPEDLPGLTVALVLRDGEVLRADAGWIAPALAEGGSGVTLLVGAEREGLRDDVIAACDHAAHLPIPGGAESLNAAMAATTALYELARG
ncbi:MAG: TrmH family RNA methyltransferase [Solirubrobacteraceae bacterium]